MNFNQLTKNLKKDFSPLKKVKIALLGDSATQMLAKAMVGYGYEVGLHFDLFEADYDQIDRQIFDANSELHAFKPEFIIIFQSANKLLKKFYSLDNPEKVHFSDTLLGEISGRFKTLQESLAAKVIVLNFIEINDSVFGNFANKINDSFLYQIRKSNFELMNLSQAHKDLFVCDVSALHNSWGSSYCTDMKTYINADMVFSIDFLPIVAKNVCDIIQSILGTFKKCLILDLDNTLWGGIIGDDGLENIQIGDLGIGKAFTELQLWIKQLKKRGIILAVCSKNTESIAKEPFEKHPEMKLRLEDIAVFVANWENKVDNIRHIQSILNIGFDSMVFLDDNPFERNMVKTSIPEIIVPELPEDPAEYLPFLRAANLFETASFTENDERRTQQYQQESLRATVQKSFSNEDEFLASLNMASVIQPFNKFNIPRVAQLTQRSNQFNLRTIRYTESEIQAIAGSAEYCPLTFTLEDRFGNYGLISVVILKKKHDGLFIDTWIMSCRVLKRGMERFVLNEIVATANRGGYAAIQGEYIPTAKNAMVKDHYKTLGFKNIGDQNGLWILSTETFGAFKTFITPKLNKGEA
jgi:FkbH-like protein